MARVFLSLGSNINREYYIRSGLDALSMQFGALNVSSVFESEAVGFQGDHFYNLVVELQTQETLNGLFLRLREIEHGHDRCRQAEKFSARTLDIDILLYDDYVGSFAGGQLPRDEISRNAFVLWPLAELAPTLELPELPERRRSIGQLWDAFDRTTQSLWPVSFIWNGQELSRHPV